MALGLPSFGGIGDIVAFVKMEGLTKFNSDIDKMNSKVNTAGIGMSKVFAGGVVAAIAVLALATKAAAQFEAEMANVNTLLDVSDSQFQKLNQGVLDIASTIPVSMQSLTKGLYDLVSAGADSENAIGALELASKAATAGLTGVDYAIKAGMATINAYGMNLSELNRVYDLQFSTVKKGVLTYEQLANSIGNVLPSAANLGVALEDVYGALAHVTKSGIDAQSATTYLARAFQTMVENSDKWKALGANIYDATGEFRGLENVIGDLAGALQGLTTEQKMMELETLGMEQRSSKAILTMVNNYEGFKQTLEDVADSAGAMQEAFEKQMDTFKAQGTLLKNKIQVQLIELGTKILPDLTEALKQFGVVVVMIGPPLIELAKVLIDINKTAGGLALLINLLTPLRVAIEKKQAALKNARVESEKYYNSIKDIKDISDKDIFGLEELPYVATGFRNIGEEAATVAEKVYNFGVILNKIETKKATDGIGKLEKELKLLEDANIKTTAEITNQIAELKKLIPLAEVHAPHAVATLKDELEDMKLVVGDSTGKYAKMAESMKELEFHTDKVDSRILKTLPTIKKFNADIEILKSTTMILAEQFIKLGGGLEVVGIALMAIDFKKTEDGLLKLDISAKSAAQAFEMFANWAIQDAQDALDEFNKLMEDNQQATLDLIQVQKALYESQQDVYEALGITTVEMNKLNDELNTYLHRLDDTNITAELFEETLARIAEILARMETISEAWKFDEAFKEMYDTLVGLTEYYAYMVAMYGEGFPGAAAMREQLLAQAQAALALLLTLDPLSAAYAALAAQIQAVEGILGISIAGWQNLAGAISGVLASVLMTVAAISTQTGGGRSREELQDAREGLEGIESALNGVSGAASQFANEWEGLRDTLMGSFDYMNSGMESLRGFVDEMVYMGKPLDSVSDKINSALSEWQAYINTLEPGSQAFEDANAEMQDMIKYLESLGFQVTIDPNALFTGPQGTGGYGGALGEVLDILTGGDDAIIIPVEVDLDLPEEFEDFKRWTDDMKISGHLFGFTMTINWLGENLTHVLEQLGQVTSQTWKIGMKITWDGESLNDTIRKLNTVVGGDMSSGSALAAVTPKPVLQAGAPGSQTNRPAEFNVNISNTLPIQTVVEITDAVIAPRIREIDRKLQPAGSGF